MNQLLMVLEGLRDLLEQIEYLNSVWLKPPDYIERLRRHHIHDIMTNPNKFNLDLSEYLKNGEKDLLKLENVLDSDWSVLSDFFEEHAYISVSELFAKVLREGWIRASYSHSEFVADIHRVHEGDNSYIKIMSKFVLDDLRMTDGSIKISLVDDFLRARDGFDLFADDFWDIYTWRDLQRVWDSYGSIIM